VIVGIGYLTKHVECNRHYAQFGSSEVLG
jgi:hypothetical protein